MKRSAITCAMLSLAIPATAGATTFSGSCVAAGTVTMTSPVGYVPSIAGMEFVSRGTCSGTLDGRPVEDVRVSGRSIGAPGPLSCLSGLASGTTTLHFHRKGRDPVLHLRFDDVNLLTEAVFTLRGRDGGLAAGRHQLMPDAQLNSRCLHGTVTKIGNTVSLATATEVTG